MKLTIRGLISLPILLLVLGVAHAEKPEMNLFELLSERMSQIRNNRTITIDDQQIIGADSDMVLEALKLYEEDPSPQVRFSAYNMSWEIAMRSSSRKIRQEVVKRLLQASYDPDPIVWQQATKRLLSFRTQDFSGTAKASIREFITKDNPKREMILVAGLANMQDEMATLRTLLIDESQYESGLYSGRWYGTIGWAARLALARMGSQEDIVYAIKMADSERDPVIRVTRLLHDLAYIRQPPVIKALQRHLDNDDRLPRVKANVPGTRYCQYALDLLAQILEGFPVNSVGPGGYSQSEIDICREWMNKQNQWRIIR